MRRLRRHRFVRPGMAPAHEHFCLRIHLLDAERKRIQPADNFRNPESRHITDFIRLGLKASHDSRKVSHLVDAPKIGQQVRFRPHPRRMQELDFRMLLGNRHRRGAEIKRIRNHDFGPVGNRLFNAVVRRGICRNIIINRHFQVQATSHFFKRLVMSFVPAVVITDAPHNHGDTGFLPHAFVTGIIVVRNYNRHNNRKHYDRQSNKPPDHPSNPFWILRTSSACRAITRS